MRSGFLLGTCAALLTMAAAAEAALSVSPSRVVLQGKPNQRLVGYFKVENRGEVPLRLEVEPEDWSEGLAGRRGEVSWISVRPRTLTVRPGKPTRVKYTIQIPEEASGELRTQVFFTTEQVAEGKLPVRSRLGTIIYVGVEGTEQIDAAITRVSAYYTASTPGLDRPDRLDVAIGVRNQGNAHISPAGQVLVRDADGRVAARLELPAGWSLLPNEHDIYHAIGHGIHLPPGPYGIELTLVVGGDLWNPVTVTRTVSATVAEDGTLELAQDEPDRARPSSAPESGAPDPGAPTEPPQPAD